MTLEEVVKKALSDNADCLGGECDCVALGVAKAVRGFLLSDEVVDRVSASIASGVRLEWHGHDHASINPRSVLATARAALSSITGDE